MVSLVMSETAGRDCLVMYEMMLRHISMRQMGDCRTGNVRIRFPLAGVGLDVLDTTENLEGRVALDAELLAQFLLLCAVNLDQGNVFLLQRCRGGFVLWGERFAVAAPWREDCRNN